MSTNTVQSEQQEWFHGIDLFSRLTGPIAEMTRLQQSLLFAELSQIAYMPPEPALSCVRKIGFLESLYFDHDGAQAYRFRNERDSVIVCRGTEPNEWNDVKADANAVTVLAETIGRVRDVEGWRRVVDRLRGFIRGLRRFNIDHFSDHSIEYYIAYIHAAVQKQQQAMTRRVRRRSRTAAM
jgi:hypothetical protein